jgi:hypothetical protein
MTFRNFSRRAVLAAGLGLLVAATTRAAAGQTAGAPAAPPLEADAQAVYGVALQARFTAEARPLTDVTLLQQTRAVLPPACDLQRHAPPEWRETIDSFVRENAADRPLAADVSVGVPPLRLTLLTLDALKTMMRAGGYDLTRDPGWQTPGAEIFARLKGGQLVAVSAVGFSGDRSRAMVTVQSNCFPSERPDAKNTPCEQGRQLLMS